MLEKFFYNPGKSIKVVVLIIGEGLFILTTFTTIIFFFIFVTDSYGQQYLF